MKLISMTDFVLKKTKYLTKLDESVYQFENCEDKVISFMKYANFLQQPLNLGMFIPSDDYGNVLEDISGHGLITKYSKKVKEYQDAKSKVLFNNFRIERYPDEKFENISATLRYKDCYVGITHKDSDKMKLNDTCAKETIEDLICFNLDLTVSF